MSDSGRFCPECGDPVEVEPGVRSPPESAGGTRRRQLALCDSCYFDRFDIVDAPDRIEIRVCASCGAIHRGNRWVDVGASDYTDVAIDAVTEALAVHVDAADVSWAVEPEQVDPNTIRMHATFEGIVRGTPVRETVVVPVKISRETCTRCGRIAGEYYASTVQVRALDRDPTREELKRAREVAEDVVSSMEETGDRDAFITEASEVDEGLDLKVSTSSIGRKIAAKLVEEFGGDFDSSETLVTEDSDGNEVYRVTYAVRLPPYVPGEVIDPADDEGPVLVRSVRGNLKGIRLATGAAYESSLADAGDPERLGHREDATETTLVAVEDENAVQVLDPETFESKTIPRPDYLDQDADSVPVLKHRSGLHVLPEA